MDTKTRILDVAMELVQTRGYSAFSYQDISDRLDIAKASIHHHYPSKEILGKAVAEKYSRDVRAFLDSVKRDSGDPWKQFDGYLRMVTEIIHTKDRICAAGSVQSEINVVPPEMGKSMCSLVQYVIGWIAEVISDGRKRGVMEFSGRPKDQAAMIFSAAQGAMQYGRAQGEKKSRVVLRQLKELMEPKS